MNPTHPCDAMTLHDLLNDDCDLVQMSQLESHLEDCEHCQKRLAEMAADDELWTQAACHLSSVDEIELPEELVSKLNETGSLVIPKIDRDVSESQPSPASVESETEWMQILDPPSHPEMLGRIDQFEVDSKIGQGGMGIVLKCLDRELNRPVAIKLLTPHLAANGTARKRFIREAQAAGAVIHENVVPIHSVNKSTTRPYIVMQLVPGHSLQSLVKQEGPLDPKEVVRISMQIAAGLQAAHHLGLIHRDVKPANVLVENDGTRVMITDFGLARAADDAGLTQTGWLAGTPHYMSPEQSKGDELDRRTDLFSLGSLMYFLATGREPFRGERPYAVIQKIITQRPTNPISLNADIPQTLADVIEKLLEKDPKDRFQSAREVVAILEQYLAYLQQPQTSRPPKRILTARRKRHRTWIALGSLLTVTLIAGYFGLAPMFRNAPNIEPTHATGLDPEANPNASSPPPAEPQPGQPSTSNSPFNPELASSARPGTTANAPKPEPFNPRTGFESLMQFDKSYSAELEALDRELRQFESSLNETEPLDGNNDSSRFSNPMIRESQGIQSQIQQLESVLHNQAIFLELKRAAEQAMQPNLHQLENAEPKLPQVKPVEITPNPKNEKEPHED